MSDDSLMPKALYSDKVEQAVLGSMLAQPATVIDEAHETLIKTDFFVPAHQEIFGVLTEMHNTGTAIDVATVHQHLIDRKLDQTVGSPAILGDLYTAYATHLNVGSYIKIVKDKSLLRTLQKACSTIAQDIADRPDEVAHVLDAAEATIYAVSGSMVTSSTTSLSVSAKAACDRVLAYTTTNAVTGIQTGFQRLNQLTQGWQDTDLIVLAARPGVGKTALALKFLLTAIKNKWDDQSNAFRSPGHVAGMSSMEMAEFQLNLRLLSIVSGVPLQVIRSGPKIPSERQALIDAAHELSTYSLHIDDESALTITKLRSKTRRLHSRYGIAFLVVDYIQLMHSPSKNKDQNRQNEVAEISGGLKALAKELKIPIIALAQLNRRSAETETVPGLHNLRESGAIEQDADIVMLLHRPNPPKPGDAPIPAHNEYDLIVAKQRNGPTDTVKIGFTPATTEFTDSFPPPPVKTAFSNLQPVNQPPAPAYNDN